MVCLKISKENKSIAGMGRSLKSDTQRSVLKLMVKLVNSMFDEEVATFFNSDSATPATTNKSTANLPSKRRRV